MVGVVPFVGDTTGEFGIRKSPILNLSCYFQSVNNEQLFTFYYALLFLKCLESTLLISQWLLQSWQKVKILKITNNLF